MSDELDGVDMDDYWHYLDEHRAISDAEFAAGGHDYDDPDEFYADGDSPMSYDAWYASFIDHQEEDAIIRKWESRRDDRGYLS